MVHDQEIRADRYGRVDRSLRRVYGRRDPTDAPTVLDLESVERRRIVRRAGCIEPRVQIGDDVGKKRQGGGAGEAGSGEDGSGEDGSGEDGSGEDGDGEDGNGEDGNGKTGAGKTGAVKTGTAKIGRKRRRR